MCCLHGVINDNNNNNNWGPAPLLLRPLASPRSKFCWTDVHCKV